ncbi:MAG: hypothetical protein [Caudoviricetes sp.]|nr:MAG: hypothetical protein [Caudoviricetes sp.]
MLTENRYRNRNIIREYLNEKGTNNLQFDGHRFLFKADIHIADRMTDREFPFEEFEFIILALIKNKHILIDIVNNPDIPPRVNLYGRDDYMIGVTLHKSNTEDGKHLIVLRTLYKERNSKNRERNVTVHKVKFA